MDVVNILRDLVKFNTIKDKENKKILDYIENYLLKLGFNTKYKNKYLIMEYGKNIKFGFIGHSDTVEYIDGWNSDPFILTKKDNNLYGLGACDMKGGIAAFLSAISDIDLKNLKYGIRVYITYDEEIGFTGIKEIVEKKEIFPEYVLVGEPTENKEMIGCKGLFAIKLYTKGIKVHSSTPDKGISANTSMIRLLCELEDFYNEKIRNIKNNKYEISNTTMNIGLLNGGSAINSVAAECMSYIDFRTISNKHVIMLKEKLDELCKKYDGYYIVDIDVNTFYNEISNIKKDYTAGFMTEASFINNCKKIILGPGPMTAHEINEHVDINSLLKCKEQYKNLIEKICN